jgi:hypothetical protein
VPIAQYLANFRYQYLAACTANPTDSKDGIAMLGDAIFARSSLTVQID